MTAIDKIFLLLELNGPMSATTLAASLDVAPKYVRDVIRVYLAKPDGRSLYAVGEAPSPRGRATAVWSVEPVPDGDATDMVFAAVGTDPMSNVPASEPHTDREDQFIAECLPLLRDLVGNVWRTCILQVAA